MTYENQFLELLIARADQDLEPWTAEWFFEWFVGAPLRILGLVLAAILLRWLIHRAIDRIVIHSVPGEPPRRLLGSRRAAQMLRTSSIYSQRRALRAQTLGGLLKSITTFVIATVAGLMALAEYYEIGPLLASAGIVGVALGFGAQNLVKDFISGVFMLLEDQYGVGDVIDMGEASGTVEDVSLRVTRLRDVNGTVWHVRNGEVLRIGNMSQGWARAVLDVAVSYEADIQLVRALLEDAARDLAADAAWEEMILDEPEVWGVEQLAPDAVVVRVVLKTRPLEQWKVAREMRERIKNTLEAHGVEIPYSRGTVWVRQAGTDREPPAEESNTDPDKDG